MHHTSDVIAHIQALRAETPQLRISFVSGFFRIIHIGHIRLLRFAKETADILVVGILPEPEQPITQAQQQGRLEAIQSIISVDYAELTCDLGAFLEQLKPDFVIKGKEHELKHNIEQSILDSYGGLLLFTAGVTGTDISDNLPLHKPEIVQLAYPQEFCRRHAIRSKDLLGIMKAYTKLKVCIVGDIIVDEYINCEALGMSQEDPTIVVSPLSSEKYLGGAGIVAAHAAGLGAQVKFFSVCGEDDTAHFAEQKLAQYNVESFLFRDKSRPTTLKQRFRCKGKTLLRVSHLRQHAISYDLAQAMFTRIAESLEEADLVIFSDFNYGCLPQFFVEKLIEKATAHDIMISADSQSSSQVGDVSRFTHAALLTPTEREARLALKDFESGLVVLACKLMEKAHAKNVVITLGEAGSLVQANITDQIPALNGNAIDSAGAGDSFLVSTSLALAAKATMWQAASLGSIVAAIQVSREGNIPILRELVMKHITQW